MRRKPKGFCEANLKETSVKILIGQRETAYKADYLLAAIQLGESGKQIIDAYLLKGEKYYITA